MFINSSVYLKVEEILLDYISSIILKVTLKII